MAGGGGRGDPGLWWDGAGVAVAVGSASAGMAALETEAPRKMARRLVPGRLVSGW